MWADAPLSNIHKALPDNLSQPGFGVLVGLRSRSTYSEESPEIVIWACSLFPWPNSLPDPEMVPLKPVAAFGPDV